MPSRPVPKWEGIILRLGCEVRRIQAEHADLRRPAIHYSVSEICPPEPTRAVQPVSAALEKGEMRASSYSIPGSKQSRLSDSKRRESSDCMFPTCSERAKLDVLIREKRMKPLNKHLVWTLALVLGGSIGAVKATAQDRDWRDRYGQNGYQDWSNNRAYQEGMRDGQRDRYANRAQQYRGRYSSDPAYQAGYNRGYGEVSGNGRWGRDRSGYGRDQSGYGYGNGGYGNGGYGRYGNGAYGNNAAQQVGYQDGINDGRQDRQTGHSFRPQQQQAYKNADHNYSAAYGDRQQYKDAYRVAYQQGYQQGYNVGGGYRR